MKDIVSLEQAADRLGVHIATLRKWVREGKVPAYRVGGRFVRVSWPELLQAIATGQERRLDPGTLQFRSQCEPGAPQGPQEQPEQADRQDPSEGLGQGRAPA